MRVDSLIVWIHCFNHHKSHWAREKIQVAWDSTGQRITHGSEHTVSFLVLLTHHISTDCVIHTTVPVTAWQNVTHTTPMCPIQLVEVSVIWTSCGFLILGLVKITLCLISMGVNQYSSHPNIFSVQSLLALFGFMVVEYIAVRLHYWIFSNITSSNVL